MKLKTLLQNYPPLALALFSSLALFISHPWQLLTFLSPNSDNRLWGFDYFGLPRCGLAILQGENIAGSDKFIEYGPWSTDWASHPAMCLVLGVPLSQFGNPWLSYFVANSLYFCFHVYALVSLSQPLADGTFHQQSRSEKYRHFLFALLVGGFFPFVIIYHFAQYHALSVLAVTFLLQSEKRSVFGFIISALSKPLLAPAGLLLAVRRQWKMIAWILAGTVIGTAPWFILDALTGRQSMTVLGGSGLNKLRFSVLNWEQEQSLAKVFETLISPQMNFYLRLAISAMQMFTAALIARYGDLRSAFCVAVLVFFTLYARGHEYHAVTLIPVFIYLFAKGTAYRTWIFMGIVALFALPTTYPVLHYFLGSEKRSIANYKMTSPVLGWIFVLQRPVAVMALWLCIVQKEFLILSDKLSVEKK
ncbi:MAG: hypothetical protein RL189_2447 [Pseudomonadota bacterium]